MKYKTAFRLALRAIGVLVLTQTLPGLLIFAAGLALSSLLGASLWTGLGGYELRFVLQYSLGACLGLYLLLGGGRWLVDRAIPSNRPYCQECGYELTGLPLAGACPECGTAYRLGRAAEVANEV
jgi:hypothetical protein